MRKTLAYTALAAVLALPLIAGPTAASAASCHSRKTTGTIIGGVGGALLGNAVSHGGGGAIVGGLGGAVVGHEIGKGGCSRTAYHSGRTRYSNDRHPSRPVRKVYYDQYGNRVASEPVEYRR
ncbi:hypothetical protein [Phenylobacterium sp.]|uniref:hypothetical protein n=1 Tax=Phenylobacterium sp. TaxID=1871053 RepID=UPI0025DB1367|nr:hypothetical protein [Phenylobacterium sp.]